jgi:hypothetical protein
MQYGQEMVVQMVAQEYDGHNDNGNNKKGKPARIQTT